MPVTKTAKRALRGSRKKASLNVLTITKLEAAVRLAKKKASRESILAAISLADRAAKKHAIHKNKASRIKSTLTKLLPKSKKRAKPKKTSKR